MSLSIYAKKYSGDYGFQKNTADIVHIKLYSENQDHINFLENKEVILVIDVSSSMYDSLPKVKASLLAFRDALLQKSHEELDPDPVVRDINFRDYIDMTIVVFSEKAKVIWCSKNSIETYEQAVHKMKTESLTNLGAGIELAFSKKDLEKNTWIIVMSDGECNKGQYRTCRSFKKLCNLSKPQKCKLISLGYGQQFDSEVLRVLGNFVYIDNSEKIPYIFGNIAEEINTAWAYDCEIDIFNDNHLDDDIIIPEGKKDSRVKILIGDKNIETLSHNKTYHLLYLPHGNIKDKELLNEYKSVKINFKDLENLLEAKRFLKYIKEILEVERVDSVDSVVGKTSGSIETIKPEDLEK